MPHLILNFLDDVGWSRLNRHSLLQALYEKVKIGQVVLLLLCRVVLVNFLRLL